MAVGKNFLQTLERRKRLLERLQALEEEIREEEERLRIREQEWAIQALCAVLEEEGVWDKISRHWEEVARDRFELWRALGLKYLLPEGREARLEVGNRTIADKHEERLATDEQNGRQEEQEEAQPGPEPEPEEAAQPRMGGAF